MRLKGSNQSLEVFGEAKTLDFQIGDARVILDILRNSIYKNPKAVITKELMSNARDANIESGNENIPIKVKLPNGLDPVWEVSDDGPGISPDRMENVFTKFACSTKRNDDKQVGKFGIGAKSPFSYTDSFVIKTAAVEDGSIVYREYCAALSEDRGCKLLEISEPQPAEKTGTTISIAIKSSDIYDFVRYTHDIAKFWSVTPTLITKEVVKPTIDFENDHYILFKENVGPICLVNEISYPLDSNLVKNSELLKRMLPKMALKVDGNDVTVAASRESLQYDEETTNFLIERLRSIRDTFIDDAKKEIVAQKTIYDAMRKYLAAREKIGDFDVEYDGVKIRNIENIRIDRSIVASSWVSKKYDGKVKVTAKGANVFSPLTTCLVVNDDNKAIKDKSAVLFSKNHNVTDFILVRSRVPHYKDYENLDKDERKVQMAEDAEKYKQEFEQYIKDSHLERFVSYKLSDYKPPKGPRIKKEKTYKIYDVNRATYGYNKYYFKARYLTALEIEGLDCVYIEYISKADANNKMRYQDDLRERLRGNLIAVPTKNIPLLKKGKTPEEFRQAERDAVPKILQHLQIINNELKDVLPISTIFYNDSLFSITYKVHDIYVKRKYEIDALKYNFEDENLQKTCRKLRNMIKSRYPIAFYLNLPYNNPTDRNAVIAQVKELIQHKDKSDPIDIDTMKNEIMEYLK
jgi:hypothetical protein